MADPNVLVMKQRCMMHQANLTTEQMWKTMGVLPGFCFSSILTQGSLFYELICQCKRIIESKLVIRYDPRCAKLWFAIVDVILSKSWLLDFINCFRKRGLFFSDRQGGTTALHFCEVVALHSILQDGKLLNR
ncbi:unnamed protein product [Symbiodinium sp. KB8]|nr:unnamed protein product [Symbiodinium sp. KB8]